MLQRSPSSRKRRSTNNDTRRTSVAFNLECQPTRLTESGGRQQTQQSPQQLGGQHRRASIAVTSPSDGFEMRQRNRTSPEEEFLEYSHKRSPRPSFVSETKVQYIDKSPRNSLVPEMSKSPRTSLVPSDHRKPPRLLPDELHDSYARSSSRLEVDINRSPRHSITCEHPDPRSPRSPRGSMVPEDDYSELRSGLRLDVENFNRSPRSSTVGLDPSRSPKNSLVPDPSRSPRGSIAYDLNRSSRGSLAVTPDANRSPRGSLVPDPGKSPRGSVASEGAYNMSRSARGSIAMAESASLGRTPRGSISSVSCVHFDPQLKSTRNSNETGSGSPKGTLKDTQKSSPPCKTTSQYTQKQAFPDDSRRASSSVSQVSGDERKRLCEHSKPCDAGLTVYGSLTYQLNHANMESTGIFDFIIKALSIIHRTVIVTVILSILTMVPLIMFVVGVQFVRDCPREPHIPVYMIVGGIFGMIKMVWLLCRQVKSLRYNKRRRPDMGTREDMVSSMGSRIASVALTAFLVGWFALGNYWILSVYWPDSEPSSLYEPNGWCNRTLYVTSLVHLVLVYVAAAVVLGAVVAVLVFQQCALRFK